MTKFSIRMERETGIEPATNSLEGCDSTTELLPPRSPHFLDYAITQELNSPSEIGGEGRTRTFEAARATDLQSAAFDRFATSPAVCVIGIRVFDAYCVCRLLVRW